MMLVTHVELFVRVDDTVSCNIPFIHHICQLALQIVWPEGASGFVMGSDDNPRFSGTGASNGTDIVKPWQYRPSTTTRCGLGKLIFLALCTSMPMLPMACDEHIARHHPKAPPPLSFLLFSLSLSLSLSALLLDFSVCLCISLWCIFQTKQLALIHLFFHFHAWELIGCPPLPV